MIHIFDTHAHYDDEAFDEDREQLLATLPENGITRVVNIGSSLASCKRTIELMEKYDYIYGALGVHPSETGELDEASFAWLSEQCHRYSAAQHSSLHDGAAHNSDVHNGGEHNGMEKCVAVGEIGLDYYWDEPDRSIQKKWFVRQLQLARECQLPVVIHSRDAAKETLDIMKAEKVGEIGGVMHCYSYTKETAKILLDMGFYFGIGGVLTFKNAKKLQEAVEYIPLDRIVLETDCPYLAPTPNRGKRNSSLNLPYVVAAMAQLKGITEEEVRKAVWENSMRLYRFNRFNLQQV